MIIATLAVAALVTGCQVSPSKQLPLCESPEWARIVAFAIEGGSPNREALTQLAEDRQASPGTAALAQHVLGLWTSADRPYAVDTPRLIHPLSIQFTEEEARQATPGGHVAATMVVANVSVSSKGCVEKIEVLRGPSGTVLDLVTAKLRSAVFFPAVRRQRPTNGKATVSVRIEVR